MMYGTDKNAGVIPKEIADKLREKQYNNFDEILYLIFDYPHKYNTFKHFDV